MMNIGEILKQARLDAKLSQETAAEKASVSRQTMSNWENGKSYPDIVSVITLSDVYDVTLDSLLKGDVALLKHLKESTDVVKSDKQTFTGIIPNKQIVTGIAAVVLFLLSPWLYLLLMGGHIDYYLDVLAWFSILIPILFVLTVTRKFKLFFAGLLAAFFPLKETSKKICEQAAELFRLLSKTAATAAVMITLINLITIGNGMYSAESDDIYQLAGNLAVALVTPFCSLVLIIFVFEPVAYILKNKNSE